MEKINTSPSQILLEMGREESTSWDMQWCLYYSDTVTRKQNHKKTKDDII